MRPLYQYSEDSVYDPALSKYPVPTLIHVDNKKYGACREGSIRDVRVKGLSVLCEEGSLPPKIVAKNYFPDTAVIRSVTVEGLSLNGVEQRDLSAFPCEFEGGAEVKLI